MIMLSKATVRCASIILAVTLLVGCSFNVASFVLPPSPAAATNNRILNTSCDDDRLSLQQRINTLITAAVLFTATLTSPFTVHVSANNHQHSISIEKSQAYALNENQLFISDVWFKVTTQFFDQSFNGLGEAGWRAKEKEAFAAVEDTGPDDDELVAEAIKTMLSALGDPYTRFLPKEKYEILTAYATGEVHQMEE